MTRARTGGLLIVVLGFLSWPALAQQLIIYPAQGQTQAQQDRDRFECHSWAVQQSGFDPSMGGGGGSGSGSGSGSQPIAGGLLQGGARGAAVGAVGGAIAGNAGRGAAIGASTGALLGGMRRADQNRNRNSQRDSGNNNNNQRDAYNRAMRACMQGRGYIVS
ncbi:MAG: YMGG-like glycine zipper-containing protein [Dongiaceae bacterium]